MCARFVVVGEAVEVEVRVLREHDGRLLLRRHGAEGDVPVPSPQGVGGVRDDLAGEALLAVRVDDGEGDAVVCVPDDGEVAPAPAVGPAVERVDAVWVFGGRVVVGFDVVGHAVNVEGAILDAIRISTGDVAVIRMGFIYRVMGRI